MTPITIGVYEALGRNRSLELLFNFTFHGTPQVGDIIDAGDATGPWKVEERRWTRLGAMVLVVRKAGGLIPAGG